MAKTRARARAERERLAAIAAAERATTAAHAARKRARRARLTGWLPRRSRPGGVLAEKRRTQQRMTVAVLVAAVVLVFLVTRSWPAVALAVVASLLVGPVLYTMLSRKG